MLIYSIANFLIGSCLASHINVIYDRFNKTDFIRSRSRCDNCYTQLSLLDEIPLISYLFLLGHCRYCYNKIPAELFLTELIGGFAFLNCDFHSFNGICLSILIFSLLCCAIFDYHDQEFPTVFIVPAIIIAIFNFSIPSLTDLIQFIPIFILLVYYVYKNKLGSGDLIIYLILALYFNAEFANQVFLIAAIIFIFVFILIKKANKNQRVALVPYLLLGLIIKLL